MSYTTTRFPELVAFGFSGGHSWSTRIGVVRSGREQRNQEWSASRGKWKATHKNKGEAASKALSKHHQLVMGRTHYFPFKDYLDYSVATGEGVVSLISGDNYQMEKRYTDSVLTVDRPIYRPISGTIAVSGGGSYSINYLTGVITRNSGAAPTGWTGQFDCWCRYDTDEPNIEIVSRKPSGEYIYTWGDIGIIEIRP